MLEQSNTGRTVFRALAALIIVFASALPAGAVTIFPAVGSSGEVAWDDHCPAHNYLIGLKGHVHEEEINQMQIVCATVGGGVHGTKYYGPSHGGGGGTVMEQSCPHDAIAVGVHVFVHRSEKNRIDTMPGLVLICRKISGAGAGSVLFSAIGLGDLTPNFHIYQTNQGCSDGETASGLNGHSGKIVNAIGLDCAIRTEH